QEASIKNLETQVGQLAKMMSERAQGTLPSNTEPNPRGQLNAIFSENLGEASNKQSENELNCLKEKESNTKKGSENTLKVLEPKQKLKSQERGDIEQLIYKLKQIKVNVPLLDALLCMPDHIKNLEDIFQNKRKIDEVEIVTLSAESFAILQNQLPPKLDDPGNFTIPCTIGNLTVDDALADLGASINVMPFKKFKKLGIGELRPTEITIHLADRTIRSPRGIVENILVRVDKFLFLVDFVVLDMDESFKTPLILGRPFLATARALIDVEQRELILRVREERVVLKMSEEALKSISSSNKERTFNEQLIVNLYEDTELGKRKILPQGTLNKIREILQDNPITPPKIHKQQTKTQIKESKGTTKTLEGSKKSIPKSIKKNNRSTERPINPNLNTKWVPVPKKNESVTISHRKQKSPVLINVRGIEKIKPG